MKHILPLGILLCLPWLLAAQNDNANIGAARLANSTSAISCPNDVVRYFDSLLVLKKHPYAIPIGFPADSAACVAAVRSSIAELGRYQHKQRPYYPKEEVRRAIALMSQSLGYNLFSSPKHPNDGYQQFFFHYLEQAARLCPKVELLTDNLSQDAKVGLLNFNDWASNPMLSLLCYQTSDGCRFFRLGQQQRNLKIFQLTDSLDAVYYLCGGNCERSWDCNDCNLGINVYLFAYQPDGFHRICQYHWSSNPSSLPNKQRHLYRPLREKNVATNTLPDGAGVVFNPRTRVWTHSTPQWVNGQLSYQLVPGSRSLRLVLDGVRSHFVVE